MKNVYNPERVILADADGVLLNWIDSFREFWAYRDMPEWYTDTNYRIDHNSEVSSRAAQDAVESFNESVWLEHISPMRDAVAMVKHMHENHGVVFHVITALNNHPHILKARTQNLKGLFGNAIEMITLTGDSEDKTEALSKYRDSNLIWIEDKPENADLGVEMGLRSLLMDQPYNKKHNNADVERVYNWEDVYNAYLVHVLDL